MTDEEANKTTIMGFVVILATFFVVGVAYVIHQDINNPTERPVICEVIRETKAPLECRRCTNIANNMTAVVTMTGYDMVVHRSRIRWVDSQSKEENELMKPYKGR